MSVAAYFLCWNRRCGAWHLCPTERCVSIFVSILSSLMAPLSNSLRGEASSHSQYGRRSRMVCLAEDCCTHCWQEIDDIVSTRAPILDQSRVTRFHQKTDPYPGTFRIEQEILALVRSAIDCGTFPSDSGIRTRIEIRTRPNDTRIMRRIKRGHFHGNKQSCLSGLVSYQQS